MSSPTTTACSTPSCRTRARMRPAVPARMSEVRVTRQPRVRRLYTRLPTEAFFMILDYTVQNWARQGSRGRLRLKAHGSTEGVRQGRRASRRDGSVLDDRLRAGLPR